MNIDPNERLFPDDDEIRKEKIRDVFTFAKLCLGELAKGNVRPEDVQLYLTRHKFYYNLNFL